MQKREKIRRGFHEIAGGPRDPAHFRARQKSRRNRGPPRSLPAPLPQGEVLRAARNGIASRPGERSTPAPVGCASVWPSTASMSRLAIAPGRNKRGRSSRHAMIVDSSPMGQRPPSRIRSIVPQKSSATWAAVTGLIRPERLAEGAASGRPTAEIRASATGWTGTRRAIAVKTRPRGRADRRAGRQRNHQRQRPRPKCPGKLPRFAVENALFKSRVKAFDMRDERIGVRPSLRRINAGNRRVRGRVPGKAVNGLGRKGDDTAGANDRRRLGDSSRIRRHHFLGAAGKLLQNKFRFHTWLLFLGDISDAAGLYFNPWPGASLWMDSFALRAHDVCGDSDELSRARCRHSFQHGP